MELITSVVGLVGPWALPLLLLFFGQVFLRQKLVDRGLAGDLYVVRARLLDRLLKAILVLTPPIDRGTHELELRRLVGTTIEETTRGLNHARLSSYVKYQESGVGLPFLYYKSPVFVTGMIYLIVNLMADPSKTNVQGLDLASFLQAANVFAFVVGAILGAFMWIYYNKIIDTLDAIEDKLAPVPASGD